mgnify:CR=1 FL=1
MIAFIRPNGSTCSCNGLYRPALPLLGIRLSYQTLFGPILCLPFLAYFHPPFYFVPPFSHRPIPCCLLSNNLQSINCFTHLSPSILKTCPAYLNLVFLSRYLASIVFVISLNFLFPLYLSNFPSILLSGENR